jgi:hypothetical protein
MMTKRRRASRAFTLIELLVALISASIVLGAAGSLLVSMVEDQRNASDWREHYYSRARAGMEILWTARQVPRRGLRQDAAGGGTIADVQSPSAGGAGVDLNDGLGARGIITYVRDAYTQDDPLGAAPFAPVPERSFTGVIFKYYSVIYRFECDFVTGAALGIPALQPFPNASGFNAMASSALKGFIETAGRVNQCEILAVGVESFDVVYVNDGSELPFSVTWSLNLGR